MKNSNDNHSKKHTKAYVAIWITLLLLTFVTVDVSYYDFGSLNIVVAMLIATIKATLVAIFFMHLKYDNRVNQIVFVSSLLFLAIFVGLTMSDTEYRPVVEIPKIVPIQEPEGNQSAKMNELRKATPELVAKGKEIYKAQCVACHGENGQGNGPAAAALNPHPRNFAVAEGWKNGRAPAQIFKTLTEGIAGSSMSSFSTLPIEERWALVHYVRILGQNPPDDTPATLAAIGIQENGATQKVSAPTLQIPVSFAIDRLVEEETKGNR